MGESIGKGLPKRLLGLMLGVVLALGLMPGLGASEALAADDTYTLEVQGSVVDGNYKLGDMKSLTFESTAAYEDLQATTLDSNVITINALTTENGTVTVSYSVTGEVDMGTIDVGIYNTSGQRTGSVGIARITCTKNTPDIPVESITLNKASAELAVGEELQLTATVLPEGATHPDLDWESSDKSVAEVDSLGNVTAVADGTATITVRSLYDLSKTATCTVTVVNAPEPEEKGTYTVTSGDKSTWTKGSGKELSFTFKRTENPESPY